MEVLVGGVGWHVFSIGVFLAPPETAAAVGFSPPTLDRIFLVRWGGGEIQTD